MENTDPTAPLLDIWFMDGLADPLRTIEQPNFICPCAETGWIENSWLLSRPMQCNCSTLSDTLHSTECDAVPCPLCPLEAS